MLCMLSEQTLAAESTQLEISMQYSGNTTPYCPQKNLLKEKNNHIMKIVTTQLLIIKSKRLKARVKTL